VLKRQKQKKLCQKLNRTWFCISTREVRAKCYVTAIMHKGGLTNKRLKEIHHWQWPFLRKQKSSDINGPQNQALRSPERLKFIAICTVLVFTSPIALPSAASSEYDYLTNTAWTAPKRILNFPPNISLGNLLLFNERQVGDVRFPHTRLNAEGKIIVPANKFVHLQASNAFFHNPKLIETFQPDAFDCIQLQLMSMDDSEDSLCDNALGHIKNLTGLKVLILDRSEVSDEALKQIKCLKNLEVISAFLTPIRGTCFKELRTLQKLRALDLSSVGLIEENLQYLTEYKSLQNLSLCRANISDKGVKLISGCSKITRLRLTNNPAITDLSVPYLRKMHSLQVLQLDGTNISFAGLQQLKGLKLQLIILPKRNYTQVQMKTLSSLLRPAGVVSVGQDKKVDQDTKAIWAPITH